MNEILDTFEKLSEKQKALIIVAIIATIAVYPQIIMLAIVLGIVYIAIKYLPNILNAYNEGKNEFNRETTVQYQTNKKNNFCSNCGMKITENSIFCSNCGHKLQTQ